MGSILSAEGTRDRDDQRIERIFSNISKETTSKIYGINEYRESVVAEDLELVKNQQRVQSDGATLLVLISRGLTTGQPMCAEEFGFDLA